MDNWFTPLLVILNNSNNYDEIDDLEAIVVIIFGRGKGKYKGKLAIIYFSCNKVGHIVARCLEKEDKDERKKNKYKCRRDDKDYKRSKDEKGKKYYYIADKKSDSKSKSNDD